MKQQELQQQASETKTSSLADPVGEKQSENVEHAKISKLMKDLFGKLDALCNFHYTPRTVIQLLKCSLFVLICMFHCSRLPR